MIGALLADLTQLAELSDLALIVPEMILVGATLVLLLLALLLLGLYELVAQQLLRGRSEVRNALPTLVEEANRGTPRN